MALNDFIISSYDRIVDETAEKVCKLRQGVYRWHGKHDETILGAILEKCP